jgi:rhodanese-related sulfurtransferase
VHKLAVGPSIEPARIAPLTDSATRSSTWPVPQTISTLGPRAATPTAAAAPTASVAETRKIFTPASWHRLARPVGAGRCYAFHLAMSDLSTPKGAYDELANIQLVDCREQYEWDAGRVEGAVHIPLNDIMGGAGSDLAKDRPIVVICRSGNRSELATMMFQARGYEAHNLEGGIEAWVADGLPIEAPDGSPGRVA